MHVIYCSLILTSFVLTSPMHNKNAPKVSKIATRFRELNDNAFVLVDGDNLRGKMSFSLSKDELFDALDNWSLKTNIDKRLCLYYDHGNENEAHIKDSMVVCFAGPSLTADDVIVRDVLWFQQRYNTSIILVTADSGLSQRCLHSSRRAGNSQLSIIDSTLFADVLRQDMSESKLSLEKIPNISDVTDYSAIQSFEEKIIHSSPFTPKNDMVKLKSILNEIGLRNQIKSIEKIVKGSGCGKKKMTKLKKRSDQLEQRLRKALNPTETNSINTRISDIASSSSDGGDGDSNPNFKEMLRMIRGGRKGGREETWERVLLAERFRNSILFDCFDKKLGYELSKAGKLIVDCN